MCQNYKIQIDYCFGTLCTFFERLPTKTNINIMTSVLYDTNKRIRKIKDRECQRNTSAFEYKNLKLIRCKEKRSQKTALTGIGTHDLRRGEQTWAMSIYYGTSPET